MDSQTLSGSAKRRNIGNSIRRAMPSPSCVCSKCPIFGSSWRLTLSNCSAENFSCQHIKEQSEDFEKGIREASSSKYVDCASMRRQLGLRKRLQTSLR